MEREHTLRDRTMCTSSERDAEIQPHTLEQVRSTLDWSWKNHIADKINVASFRQNEERHEAGIELLLSKKAAKSLIEWEPASDHIITARFESHFKKVSIVMCYAPTNTSEEEDKNSFYTQLQSVLGKIPKRNMFILMEDMNPKVGSDNTDREREMGRHGLEEINENGKRLNDFCFTNSLINEGTIFPHWRCQIDK